MRLLARIKYYPSEIKFNLIYNFVNEFNLSDLHQLSKDICIIYRNYDDINHLENILKLKDYIFQKNLFHNEEYYDSALKVRIRRNIEIIANKSLIFSYKVKICIEFGYFLLSNLSILLFCPITIP